MTLTQSPQIYLPDKEVQQKLQTLFGRIPEPKLSRASTALVCVDIQYDDAHPDYGIGARAKRLGMGDFLDYYFHRVQDLVVPNIGRLQKTARKKGIEVIHIRVGCNTADGRDNTRRYSNFGFGNKPHAEEAQIIKEIAPRGDEIVLNKVTSSVFNYTNIDRLLRNMGIRDLIFVGVVTNGCVEANARSAADLDYGVIVVEDATAAMAPQLHDRSILSMSYLIANIKSTEEVVAMLSSL